MENKTAVEWLIEQIKDDQFKKVKTDLQWSKIFEQAKEMEKKQIIEAHGNKQKRGGSVGYVYYNLSGEQYYNETYKSKQDEI